MRVDYNKFGKCIDNVYDNLIQRPTIKVISTLNGNILQIRFVSIISIVKEKDKDIQMKIFKEEAIKCILEKIKLIEECYKEQNQVSLKIENGEIKNPNPFFCEVLTVSPFSVKKTMKFNYIMKYDLEKA